MNIMNPFAFFITNYYLLTTNYNDLKLKETPAPAPL